MNKQQVSLTMPSTATLEIHGDKMTFRAIDPSTGSVYEADWFHENRKNVGLCEVCKSEIELRAGTSIETNVHFWHGKGATCPTIKNNRKKYEDLPSSEMDLEAGKILRQSVKDNAYLVYGTCNAIVDGLKYAEFKELIAKASEKGIWDYKGLALNYVPYLLVTFHDIFYAKGSKLRDDRFYVILEPGMQYLDDLWNKPTNVKQNVWKVSPTKGVLEEIEIKDELDPEPNWFKKSKQWLKL
jgi:hypothetical protein